MSPSEKPVCRSSILSPRFRRCMLTHRVNTRVWVAVYSTAWSVVTLGILDGGLQAPKGWPRGACGSRCGATSGAERKGKGSGRVVGEWQRSARGKEKERERARVERSLSALSGCCCCCFGWSLAHAALAVMILDEQGLGR